MEEEEKGESSKPSVDASSLSQAQLIINADTATQKDATLDFTVDIVQDVERHLEELARMRRLGDFNSALGYFTDVGLDDLLGVSSLVIIEYADLLQEQGAYGHLRESLVALRPPGDSESSDDEPPIMAKQCRYILEMIQVRSEIAFRGLSRQVLSAHSFYTIRDFIFKWVSFEGSNARDAGPVNWVNVRICPSSPVYLLIPQLQLLRKTLDLSVYINPETETQSTKPRFRGLRTLYERLLAEERIWDITDLLLSLFRIHGGEKTLYEILQPKHPHGSLAQLLRQITIKDYDEPTALAILTILTAYIYAVHAIDKTDSSPAKRKHADAAITRARGRAAEHAAQIAKHSPNLINSRPYLSWKLANERFKRCAPGTVHYSRWSRHEPYTPGLSYPADGIPIYIPAAGVCNDNPGWPVPDEKFPVNDTLRKILQTATELGDYRLQTACLAEMVCRAEEPWEWVKRLGMMQKDWGDDRGYVRSCMARYLLLKGKDGEGEGEASARRLLEDLEDATSMFCPPDDDVCPAFRWDEARLKAALRDGIGGRMGSS